MVDIKPQCSGLREKIGRRVVLTGERLLPIDMADGSVDLGFGGLADGDGVWLAVDFEGLVGRGLSGLSVDGLFNQRASDLVADFDGLSFDVDKFGSPLGDSVWSVEFDSCFAGELCDLLGDVWRCLRLGGLGPGLCFVRHVSTSLSGEKLGESWSDC